MKKLTSVFLAGVLLLAALGCVKAYQKSSGSEAEFEAAAVSYYAGQDSRAYRMLNKSMFRQLLNNGWLKNLEDIQNARWNYDTFTEYTVLDRDPELTEEPLYCCTFSADDGRCGYLVVAYTGDALKRIDTVKMPYLYDFLRNADAITGDALRRIDTVETPYLYDFLRNTDAIREELGKTELDLSSAAASRVQFKDDQGVSAEGILFQDSAGREYLYHF